MTPRGLAMNKVCSLKTWLVSALCGCFMVWIIAPVVHEWDTSGILSAQGRAGTRPIVIERSPLRTIKDPYPSFSAVAVNPEENMLVVTDENLYQVLEYDRRDNTPPQARLSPDTTQFTRRGGSFGEEEAIFRSRSPILANVAGWVEVRRWRVSTRRCSHIHPCCSFRCG